MDSEIKKILEQYIDLQQEKKDKQAAVNKVQKRLDEMEVSGYKVFDSVSGGDGGNQHFKIEGFPYPEYHRQRSLLLLRRKALNEIQHKIDEQLAAVEQYINSVEDSRMRRILTYRYIDGLSWQQVAWKMGGGNTANGIRMAVDRYLNNIR